jgi:AcrR family transcriptional regulator
VSATLTRRDAQREETRRRIYAAAIEIFRRDGVEVARIEEIVERAGVSRGSFYFHFPTKDDVLAEAYALASSDLVSMVELLPVETPVLTTLRHVVEHIATRWDGDPKVFVPVGLFALRSVSRSFPAGQREPIRDVLTGRFRHALDQGELESSLPAELLADIFLLNAFTALRAWSGNPQISAAPALDAVVMLFLHGAARATGEISAPA